MGSLQPNQIHMLEGVQRKAARFVCGSKCLHCKCHGHDHSPGLAITTGAAFCEPTGYATSHAPPSVSVPHTRLHAGDTEAHKNKPRPSVHDPAHKPGRLQIQLLPADHAGLEPTPRHHRERHLPRRVQGSTVEQLASRTYIYGSSKRHWMPPQAWQYMPSRLGGAHVLNTSGCF